MSWHHSSCKGLLYLLMMPQQKATLPYLHSLYTVLTLAASILNNLVLWHLHITLHTCIGRFCWCIEMLIVWSLDFLYFCPIARSTCICVFCLILYLSVCLCVKTAAYNYESVVNWLLSLIFPIVNYVISNVVLVVHNRVTFEFATDWALKRTTQGSFTVK